ncbi:ABC transporter substrate-binding protein [Halobacteriovorax sp. HLS]|uniref:substrate-binding periplasmic protein n=1 Tax=Halobacteriovorax sp. HLS TaxID=2234000 RepID=UPI000FD8AA8D|nr:transporter substrate-binding domain-containing protein [Halobacteriovorax sp. HLS]
MRLLIFFLFISLNSHAVQFNKYQLNYVVLEKTAEPFQIINGHKDGLITDIINEINKEINYTNKINTITLPFLRALKVMEENNDLRWISYGAKEWSTIQSKLLSKEPLFKVEHKLVTRKNFRFKKIEDLFGKRIALISGFNYPGIEKYIKNKKIDVLIVSTHASALKAVKIKRADAFPEILLRVKHHITKEKLNIKDYEFHNFNKYIGSYNFHLAFSKGMKGQIDKYDSAIRKLRKDGKIKKIIWNYLR